MKTFLPPDKKLEVVYLPTKTLLPYPGNPRLNDAAVSRMVASIEEFGFSVPVLALRNGEVVDGHLRLKAAIKLGMAEVPVIHCDGWTAAQVKAFRLMVNRSVSWAEWDIPALGKEFSELQGMNFDLKATGFNDFEILRATMKPASAVECAVPSEDPKVLAKKWGASEGQKWRVGRHCVLIGDSSLSEISADGVCTDPPYDLGAEQCAAILRRFAPVSVVLAGSKLAFGLTRYLDFRLDFVWKHGQSRSWPKLHMPLCYHANIVVLARSQEDKTGWKRATPDHGSVYETGSYSQDEGASCRKGSRWEKPVSLFLWMLSGFAWRHVIDPFGGHGTTLLACEQTGRTCTMLEIDPEQAAVALERFSIAGLEPRLG